MWFATRQTMTAALAGSGSGSAHITLERVSGRICFRLNWSGIGSPVAAQIQDRDGAVVALFVDKPKRRGCVKANKSLIRQIAESPRDYHVRLTTQRYPEGALQGSF